MQALIRTSLASTLVLFAAVPAIAQVALQKQVVNRHTQQMPLAGNGTVTIENPVGSVIVTGSERPGVVLVAERVIRAADDAAVREAATHARVFIDGNEQSRTIKAQIPPASPNRRWVAHFNYNLRVPQTSDVTLITGTGEHIRVTNIGGTIRIRNIAGEVQVIAPRGPLVVDSINGNVRVAYLGSPGGHARVSSVNGDVQVSLPTNARLRWVAETLRGEFLATLPVAGKFLPVDAGRVYEGIIGSINSATPKVHATSVTGRVFLLRAGSDPRQAVAIEERGRPSNPPPQLASSNPGGQRVPMSQLAGSLVEPPAARSFAVQHRTVEGDLTVPSGVGNVFAGEVSGDVRIVERAGEVVLVSVAGRCEIVSLGGPVNLGTIAGPLEVSTRAGDVLVQSARRGGRLHTDGGNVQVGIAGGPIEISSGGGDVIVRQANGPVSARTSSGDISVRVAESIGTQRVDLSTASGNVLLVVPSSFAADVDIEVLTAPNRAQEFLSEFPGLTVTRQAAGNRMRIRASGQINGGGQKVTLRAEEGQVHLRRSGAPTAVQR